MNAEQRRYSRAGGVQIRLMDATEQTRRIHAATASRAYEIFRSRPSGSCHEAEDWRLAESQLVRPMCFGEMPVNGHIWIGTNLSSFLDGTTELWVSPRQITISGKPCRAPYSNAIETNCPPDEPIFRVAHLPVEIDPSGVEAKVDEWSLEILLKKARPNARERRMRAA